MSRRVRARGRLVLPFVVGAALASAGSLSAQEPRAVGIVKTLTGAAAIIRSGQELAVAPGLPIVEGDTLRTSADGSLGVTLKDGTRLSLGERTELRVETFAYEPAQGRLALALRLLRGLTDYVSGRIAQLAPGAVKIETPTSVIGIRGTHLLIGVDQP